MPTPRVINEFEGGPTHLYWGKHPYKNDDMRHIVFECCKTHESFWDQKITPIIEVIKWEEMPLITACEECDECDSKACPKPIEEVYEKGSGVKIVEVLEGWFVDFGLCIPMKMCECCKGKGWKP